MLAAVAVLHAVPRALLQAARDAFINSLWISKLLIFLAVVQLVIEFSTAEVAPFIYFQF